MQFKKTHDWRKNDKKNVLILEIKENEGDDPGNCNPTK